MASKILTITDISSTGEGIAKEDGKVFFVEGALPFQTVEAEIFEEKKRFSRAKMLSIVKDEMNRPNICLEKECGGCMLKDMPYSEQLSHKAIILQNAFKKIAGIEDMQFHPIVASPQEEKYRTKVEFTFGYTKTGEVSIGFHSWRDASIVPISSCAVFMGEAEQILSITRKFLALSTQKPYHNKVGFWRYLVVRYSHLEERYSIHCITDAITEGYSEVKQLGALLKELLPTSTFVHSIRTSRFPVAYGEQYIFSSGEQALIENIQVEDITYRFSYGANSFFQVNQTLVGDLYAWIASYFSEKARIADICCGVGSITLVLAKKAGSVLGFEQDYEAIQFAKKNAKENSIKNTYFTTMKMASIKKEDLVGIEEICIDPPRGGLPKELLLTLAESNINRIVYVSCNSGTLARDCKILAEFFTVVESRAFDMFPHTPHCESVTLLIRKA